MYAHMMTRTQKLGSAEMDILRNFDECLSLWTMVHNTSKVSYRINFLHSAPRKIKNKLLAFGHTLINIKIFLTLACCTAADPSFANLNKEKRSSFHVFKLKSRHAKLDIKL